MKSTLPHYDKDYYRGHYGSIMDDPLYAQAVGRFYHYAIFSRSGLKKSDKILDFGSGTGQLTLDYMADCYDPSVFIQDYLREKNRRVFASLAEIPKGTYRAVFSSHSLEHSINPAEELKGIHAILEEKGLLILVLPKEIVPGAPTSAVDDNRHFFGWNFQLITNLLTATGYQVNSQRIFHAPYGLRTMTKRLPLDAAVLWSHRMGSLMQNYPALLTIAQKVT